MRDRPAVLGTGCATGADLRAERLAFGWPGPCPGDHKSPGACRAVRGRIQPMAPSAWIEQAVGAIGSIGSALSAVTTAAEITIVTMAAASLLALNINPLCCSRSRNRQAVTRLRSLDADTLRHAGHTGGPPARRTGLDVYSGADIAPEYTSTGSGRQPLGYRHHPPCQRRLRNRQDGCQPGGPARAPCVTGHCRPWTPAGAGHVRGLWATTPALVGRWATALTSRPPASPGANIHRHMAHWRHYSSYHEATRQRAGASHEGYRRVPLYRDRVRQAG